jgi:predicted NBD/HSP70 family sugar kinase
VLPHPPGLLAPHVENPLGSRQCYCGQLNCIETFLSGPGLARTHQELWGVAVDAQSVYQQAGFSDGENVQLEDAVIGNLRVRPGEHDNNPLSIQLQARTTLALYCQMLARSLAQLVNILDPTVIVLGGGLSQMTAIYQPLRVRLADLVFGGHGRTRIEAPVFGDASGVRGAAWLWSAD